MAFQKMFGDDLLCMNFGFDCLSVHVCFNCLSGYLGFNSDGLTDCPLGHVKWND